MPIYEYKCGSCGHGFEQYSAGFAKPEDRGKCPECGRVTVEKVFSTFASTGCGSGVSSGAGGCGGGSGQFS